MTKSIQPRLPPGRGGAPTPPVPGPGQRYRDLAARIASAGGDVASAVEAALRDAHRAGFSEGSSADVPEAESNLLADLATAMAEGGELRLEQPLGPCPGMPWQILVSGSAVLDGDFAALFPDAAVRGLAARAGLTIEGAAAVPGPRLDDLLPAPGPRGPS